MSVASLGEFELIDRLVDLLPPSHEPALLLGIGDDAAAWVPTPGAITVATTDALVEGVHFDLATIGWIDLGWKAMAENVSDIAAMGCRPRYALIALGLPPQRLVADIEDLYRGIAECASTYDFVVVGGDVVRAPSVVINVTLVGESSPGVREGPPPALLVRSGARAADAIAVTGPLGASAAGLRLLLDRQRAADAAAGHGETQRSWSLGDNPATGVLIQAHRRPIPRVSAARALVESGLRCAIDVSDGLTADLGHICERSHVDAEVRVDRVPVSVEAEQLFGAEALDMALAGGEDYELVCVGPSADLARASDVLVQRGEPPLTTIGVIVPRADAVPSVRLFDADGRIHRPEGRGFQHFGTGA